MSSGETPVKNGSLKKKIEPFLYLLPFAVGVCIFTLYPIVNVFLLSIKENYKHLTGAYSGFGFANFAFILSDPYFLQAIRITFQYVLVVIPIAVSLSIIFASLLNQNIHFNGTFQTLYFLPMITSVTAVGLTWKYMFNYRSGIINFFLGLAGIPGVNWLQNPKANFWALCIYGVWSMLPFTIILLLSGLQNIDPGYYTAAKVDGASPIRIFFRITVPLLSPTIWLVIIINTISAFKVFNELFPLFSGPGIGHNLYTLVYYIYYQFRGLTPPKYGRAAAAAVVLFLLILIFTRIQFLIRKWNSRIQGKE